MSADVTKLKLGVTKELEEFKISMGAVDTALEAVAKELAVSYAPKPRKTLEEFKISEAELIAGIDKVSDNISGTVLSALDQLQSEIDDLRALILASNASAKTNMANHVKVAACALQSAELIHQALGEFRALLGIEHRISDGK